VPGGFSEAGIERFHELAQRHVGSNAVPGLVALIAHAGEVHVEALGELTLGGPAVARDSLFRIASTTKPITAALTLALVREGLIALDEPVDALIPELADRRVLHNTDGPLEKTTAAWRPITPRDLLTFTFGFGMATEMFLAREPWPIMRAEQELGLATLGPPDPAAQPDQDTWIARLGSLPLLAQPGERWLYNTGASVLGVLAARASGEPFAEALRTRLLEPLGMRDTGFWTPSSDRLATAYAPTPAGLVVWDPPEGIYSRPPSFCDGAAGLVSSVDDLHAFARMLLDGGGELLPRELVHEMTRDQLSDDQKHHGGLGPDFFVGCSWGFCQAVYDDGSYGWEGGFGSSWHVDPARELCAIVLTQRRFESPELPAVHAELRAAAYAALR